MEYGQGCLTFVIKCIIKKSSIIIKLYSYIGVCFKDYVGVICNSGIRKDSKMFEY